MPKIWSQVASNAGLARYDSSAVDAGLNGTTAAPPVGNEEAEEFSAPTAESANAGKSDSALSEDRDGNNPCAAAARGVSEGSEAGASPLLSLAAMARCCLAARLRARCSDYCGKKHTRNAKKERELPP